MLTAKGFELSQRKVVAEWGIHDILAKPFSPRELLRIAVQLTGEPVAAS